MPRRKQTTMPRLSDNLCSLVDPAMPDTDVQVQGPQSKDAVPSSNFKVYSITLAQHLAQDHIPAIEEILNFMQKQYHDLQEGQSAKLNVEPFELENQGHIERIVIAIILRKKGDKFYVDYKAGHSIKAHCPEAQVSDDEDWHLSYRKTLADKVELERTSHRFNRSYPTLLSNSTDALEKRTPGAGHQSSTGPSAMSSGKDRKIKFEANETDDLASDNAGTVHKPRRYASGKTNPSILKRQNEILSSMHEDETSEILDDSGNLRRKDGSECETNGRRTSPYRTRENSCNKNPSSGVMVDPGSSHRVDDLRRRFVGGKHVTDGSRTSAKMSSQSGHGIGKTGDSLQVIPCTEDGETEIIDDSASCQRVQSELRARSSGDRDTSGRRSSSIGIGPNTHRIENDRFSLLEKPCNQDGFTEILVDSTSSQRDFRGRSSRGDLDNDCMSSKIGQTMSSGRNSPSIGSQSVRHIRKNGDSCGAQDLITEIMDDAGSWQRASHFRGTSGGGNRDTDGCRTSANMSSRNNRCVGKNADSLQERHCKLNEATEIMDDAGSWQCASAFQRRSSGDGRENDGSRTWPNKSSQNCRRVGTNVDSLQEEPCNLQLATKIKDDSGMSWQRADDMQRKSSDGSKHGTDGCRTSAKMSSQNGGCTRNNGGSLHGNTCIEEGVTEIMDDTGSWQRASDLRGRSSGVDRHTDGHRTSANRSSQNSHRIENDRLFLQDQACNQDGATEILDNLGSSQRDGDVQVRSSCGDRDTDARRTSANKSSQNGRNVSIPKERACKRNEATEIMDEAGSWQRASDFRGESSGDGPDNDGRRISANMNSPKGRRTEKNGGYLQDIRCNQEMATEIIGHSGSWLRYGDFRGRPIGLDRDTDGRRPSENISSQGGARFVKDWESLQHKPCKHDVTEKNKDSGSWQRADDLRRRSGDDDRHTDGYCTSANRSGQNDRCTGNNGGSLQENTCIDKLCQSASEFRERSSVGDRVSDGRRTSANRSSQNNLRIESDRLSLQEQTCNQDGATEILDDLGLSQRAGGFQKRSSGGDRDTDGRRTSANMSCQSSRRIGTNGDSLQENPCNQDLATEIMDESGSWQRADDMRGKAGGGNHDTDGRRTSAKMSSRNGDCSAKNVGSLQERACIEEGVGRSGDGDRHTDRCRTSANRSSQNSHRIESDQLSLQEKTCNQDGATEILGDLGSSQYAAEYQERSSGGDRDTDERRTSANRSNQSCRRIGKNGVSFKERACKQNEATEIMDDGGSWQRASDFRGESSGDGLDNVGRRTLAIMSSQNGRLTGKNGEFPYDIPCNQEMATEIIDDSGAWHHADDLRARCRGGSIGGTVGTTGRRTSMQCAPENFRRSIEGSNRVGHESSTRRKGCGHGDSARCQPMLTP